MGLVSVWARRPTVARSLAHHFPGGMYSSKRLCPHLLERGLERGASGTVKTGDTFGILKNRFNWL